MLDAIELHLGDVVYFSEFENCSEQYLGFDGHNLYKTNDIEAAYFKKVNVLEDMIDSNCILHYPSVDKFTYGWKVIRIN